MSLQSKRDTQAQHQVRWQEAGHDDLADIVVRTNGASHPLQIKSGQMRGGRLILSGHRLGRFSGVMENIAGYLNRPSANIIAVPYRQVNNEHGRQHIYQVCYVDMEVLTDLDGDERSWEQRGAQRVQVNKHGVEFSLRPSMSWQIWWSIPERLLDLTPEFSIG